MHKTVQLVQTADRITLTILRKLYKIAAIFRGKGQGKHALVHALIIVMPVFVLANLHFLVSALMLLSHGNQTSQNSHIF